MLCVYLFVLKTQVDEAYTTEEVEHFISRYPKAMQWSQRTNFRAVDHLLTKSESIEPVIHRLRLIKSSAEVHTVIFRMFPVCVLAH